MNKRFGFLMMSLLSLSFLSGCSNDKGDEPTATDDPEKNEITKGITKDLLIYVEDEEGNSLLPCINDNNNFYFEDCYGLLFDKYDRVTMKLSWKNNLYPWSCNNAYHIELPCHLNPDRTVLDCYYRVYGTSEWLNFTLKYNPDVELHADWCVRSKVLPTVICTEEDKGPLSIIKNYSWEKWIYSIVSEVTFICHPDGTYTVKEFD